MKKPTIEERLYTITSSRAPLVNASDRACEGCKALCCHDLAWPVAPPITPQNIANISWSLHFDAVKILVLNDKWYMLIEGKCIYLGDDSKCTIYETRPEQCRDHNPPYCQRYIQQEYTEITTPDELNEYLKKQLPSSSKMAARNHT